MLKRLLNRTTQTPKSKELRRQKLLLNLSKLVPFLPPFLILSGFSYLLLLPHIGRNHFVSENALQPNQVNTYWNWADVHIADTFDASITTTWSSLNSSERATAIQESFISLGIQAATQSYTFGGANLSGTNAYAILRAPKTDGAEAVVVSASWDSRALEEDEGNGKRRRKNVRGVALVLALANYLKKYSMWSKDIIFLISDGYVDGAQAFVDAYHGTGQSNLIAEELTMTTGPIWATINIDYPHHSFDHVGLFYEGINGQLPNLDLVNSLSHILRHSGITPSLHYAPPDQSPTKNLIEQILISARGIAQGPEAVWGKYRIDSISLFAVPAEGPNGFWALGRAIEGTLRSLNNLLERFHQSFFLYLMKSVDGFVPVGSYLFAPILVCAGMTIKALIVWSDPLSLGFGGAGSGEAKLKVGGGKELKLIRNRPVGKAAFLVGVTHAAGVGLWFALINLVDPDKQVPPWIPATAFIYILFTPLLLSLVILPPSSPLDLPLSSHLHSLSLLLGGLSIAIASTINYGGSVILSLFISLPIYFAPRIKNQYLFAVISPISIWGVWWWFGDREGAEDWLREEMRDWWLVGSSGSWFTCFVVTPLLIQAAMVGLCG